ncbi:hypothetical protein [Nesterenkonia sandarakina]|uniref:Secreted protein n=1 Tax=Nesterenkonia sandarakina TaxID=272918 RepID=A0A2T0YA42_9MICC|nr:hypothetical protein [Nesterenkonia sandarakina]PRZ11578.1 hypothetical protein BCL67_1482 [Nesterenkonia sandarakina]
MRLKSLAVASIAAISAGLTLGAASPVYAEVPDPVVTQLSDSQESEIRIDFDKYGVPEDTQDALIDKLEAGEPLDAFDGVSEPISSNAFETEEFDSEISWFEDGSYVVSSIEKPRTGDFAARGTVSSCSSVSTSGNWGRWTNCSVTNSWAGVVKIGFIASFEKSSSYARITNLGNVTQNCIMSCTRPDAWIIRSNQTATQAAAIQAQSTVTSPYGNSWEVWLQLRVNSNGYWTVNS